MDLLFAFISGHETFFSHLKNCIWLVWHVEDPAGEQHQMRPFSPATRKCLQCMFPCQWFQGSDRRCGIRGSAASLCSFHILALEKARAGNSPHCWGDQHCDSKRWEKGKIVQDWKDGSRAFPTPHTVSVLRLCCWEQCLPLCYGARSPPTLTPALLVNSVVPGVFLGTETILPALKSPAAWTRVSCCSPSKTWLRLGFTEWKGICHSQMAIYNRAEVAKCLNVPEAKVLVNERAECRAVETSRFPHTPDLLPSVK